MSVFLTEEHHMLKRMVRDLAQNEFAPRAEAIDREGIFPWENVKLLKEQGLLGINVPEEYGGGGADTLSHLIAIEEVARVCASTSVILTTQALAIAPVLLAATHEQKLKFLVPLASGETLGAFAITEPQAGSDNAAMITSARKDGPYYVLNGTKRFITNAGEAGLYMIIAKTDKAAGHRGMSIFLVENGTPGLSFGKNEEKMGIRGSATREVILEDCRVPRENMIGPENRGFYILMESFNHTRPGVGAQALGIAQGALDAALKYARERAQFGQPIINFQGIQFMLADMAMKVEAARNLVYQAGIMLDRGAGRACRRLSAMAKVFASDVAMQVTVDAVQIFGGYGYIREYPVERMMRDAKITQIYEGTNQILRLVIARELAAD